MKDQRLEEDVRRQEGGGRKEEEAIEARAGDVSARLVFCFQPRSS